MWNMTVKIWSLPATVRQFRFRSETWIFLAETRIVIPVHSKNHWWWCDGEDLLHKLRVEAASGLRLIDSYRSTLFNIIFSAENGFPYRLSDIDNVLSWTWSLDGSKFACDNKFNFEDEFLESENIFRAIRRPRKSFNLFARIHETEKLLTQVC